MLDNNQSIVEVISDVLNINVDMKARFSRPVDEQDRLFDPAYDHPHDEDSCINCDKSQLIRRDLRTSGGPQFHYGLVASGNQ